MFKLRNSSSLINKWLLWYTIYRGITLLSVTGKVFAHIILARIKPTLLSHRRPQQSGFTPGSSTCNRIATLCNIAQRRHDFGHPTFAAFVDLCAAFDSLSRPALWLLLLTRLFRVLYDNSVSCVRTGGTHSHSSWFRIEAGVRQAVCWHQTHLPQAWIGCWTGLSNLARLVWRLARAPSLIWILLTMSLSLLNWASCSHIGDNCEAASLGFEVNWQFGRRQRCKLWAAGRICH